MVNIEIKRNCMYDKNRRFSLNIRMLDLLYLFIFLGEVCCMKIPECAMRNACIIKKKGREKATKVSICFFFYNISFGFLGLFTSLVKDVLYSSFFSLYLGGTVFFKVLDILKLFFLYHAS